MIKRVKYKSTGRVNTTIVKMKACRLEERNDDDDDSEGEKKQERKKI